MPCGSFMLRSLRNSEAVKPVTSLSSLMVERVYMSVRWEKMSDREHGSRRNARMRSCKYFGKFEGSVYKHVRRLLMQGVRGKAIIHAHGPKAGLASGLDVDMRVPYDRSFLRAHTVFFQQMASAFGVGLLACETVPAIDLGEKRAKAKGFDDGARRKDRLF